jgi:hypothetical protein
MRPALEGQPELDFPVPGPLPAPRAGSEEDPGHKMAKQRSIARFPTDCNGPCVRTPELSQPAAPTTTTTTAPDTSSTTTTTGEGGPGP